MSIATDEAEKKYPVPTDYDDPMYKYMGAIAGYTAGKQQGYVAGRTAEVTVGEVTSAAYALWKTDANMASIQPSEAEYAEAWCALLSIQREMYEHKAFMALGAARKAVME